MTAVPLSALATSRRWQSNFMSILPAVQTHATVCFRRLNPTDQEEATAEAVARACVTYRKLVQQKKLGQVYVSNLATNAVRAVNGGRHVGGRQSCRCVLNSLTHKKKGVAVTSLSPWDATEGTWREIAVETKRVSPADTAAFRVDFAEWLAQWPPRHRKIITALAAGNRPSTVARQLGVSEGRVSQFRAKYQESWAQFQGAEAAVQAAEWTLSP